MSVFYFVILEMPSVVAEISFATLSFRSTHAVSVSVCSMSKMTVIYRKSMPPAKLADHRIGVYEFFRFTAFIMVQGAQ